MHFLGYVNHLIVISQVTRGGYTNHDIVTAANGEVFTLRARLSSRISQLDGPISDPYDDELSTPNVRCCLYPFQAFMQEVR